MSPSPTGGGAPALDTNTISDKITAFHHFTLPVANLDRSERFYTEVLGAEVTRRRDVGGPAHHISVVLGGSVRIDLFPFPGSAFRGPGNSDFGNVGHPHFAFSMPAAQLRETVQILKTKHVGFDGPVRQGPPGTASVYLDDPDGNHLELVSDDFSEADLLRVGPPDPANLKYVWE
jgi:catechol 2,3-dioxygenase-like lactoylglutathione lyase family enzyme